MYEIPFQLNINELIYYIRLTKQNFFDRLNVKKDIKCHKFCIILSRLYTTGDIKSIYFDSRKNIIQQKSPYKTKFHESL